MPAAVVIIGGSPVDTDLATGKQGPRGGEAPWGGSKVPAAVVIIGGSPVDTDLAITVGHWPAGSGAS